MDRPPPQYGTAALLAFVPDETMLAAIACLMRRLLGKALP